MTAEIVKQVLGDIIQVMTSGLEKMAVGIGKGANSFVENLITTTTGETTVASSFILVVALVGGISLAIGFGRRMFNFVTSLGGRR